MNPTTAHNFIKQPAARPYRIGLAAALAAIATGCAESGDPGFQERNGGPSPDVVREDVATPTAAMSTCTSIDAQGLTVSVCTPNGAPMVIECAAGRTGITIEAIEVALRPDAGADGELREVDVRVVDDAGVTFATSAGGHGLVLSDWTDAADSAGAEIGDRDMMAYYDVATRCGAALLDAAVPLRSERGEAFFRAAEFARSLLDPTYSSAEFTIAESTGLEQKNTYDYWRSISIRFSSRFWGAYDHSATRMQLLRLLRGTYGPPAPTVTRDTCNHGGCWSTLSSSKCSATVSQTSTSLPGSSGSCGTSTSQVGTGNCCTSQYNANVLTGGNGGHVCNDDSRRQVDVFRGRSGTAYCADSTLARDAWSSCN